MDRNITRGFRVSCFCYSYSSVPYPFVCPVPKSKKVVRVSEGVFLEKSKGKEGAINEGML